MQETQDTRVQPLGWGDPLEKEVAICSIVLAWEIPWTEDPGGGYSPLGCKRVIHDLVTKHQQAIL